MTTADLFGETSTAPFRPDRELCPGAWLLPAFALACEAKLLAGVEVVVAQSPFRHLTTPGGRRMSVAMTNAGSLGWISDRRGYRYAPIDPLSGRHWPPIPQAFAQLATDAATHAGFEGFQPDACLINCYRPGTRLTLHQDRDECDYSQPIVSISLGVPAIFLFGGLARGDRPVRVPLVHGDVVVWGGPARLRYHGVDALKPARHPAFGECRINLTFRRAG